MSVDVVHRPEFSRFEVAGEGETAFLSYEREGGVVALTHTVVPPELGGRGVAGALAGAAVDWVRDQGLTVDAQCSYVRAWLSKQE